MKQDPQTPSVKWTVCGHIEPYIIKKVNSKYPTRKKDTEKLFEAELEPTRKGVNRNIFDLKYRQL